VTQQKLNIITSAGHIKRKKLYSKSQVQIEFKMSYLFKELWYKPCTDSIGGGFISSMSDKDQRRKEN
jgi:hypothetical protein